MAEYFLQNHGFDHHALTWRQMVARHDPDPHIPSLFLTLDPCMIFCPGGVGAAGHLILILYLYSWSNYNFLPRWRGCEWTPWPSWRYDLDPNISSLFLILDPYIIFCLGCMGASGYADHPDPNIFLILIIPDPWTNYIFLLLKVAWVRVDTQTILTIHNNVITRNPRISLSRPGENKWWEFFQIRYVSSHLRKEV